MNNREVQISLRMWGDELDPESVSKRLSVRASRSQRRGERKESAAGRVFTAKTAMWELVTSDVVESKDLADHLAYLHDLLEKIASDFDEFRHAAEKVVEIYSSAGSTESSTTTELKLEPRLLEVMNQTGTALQITLC